MPKAGYLTGSRFSDFMTQGRGSALWGVTSKKLAIRIAAERLGYIEIDLDGYTSEAMEWGNEQEDLAVANYQRKTFTDVHGQQEFQQHPNFEHIGCTPDGLIGEDGLLEVKNPKTETHLFHCLDGGQLKKYKDQIQGSLWVTGRKYCDFVSHDSRVIEDKFKIHITTVERDEDYINQMEERYHEFEDKVQSFMQKLENYEQQ